MMPSAALHIRAAFAPPHTTSFKLLYLIASMMSLAKAITSSSPSCPLPPPLSCPHNATVSPCCVPSGGLIMLTQFWDPDTSALRVNTDGEAAGSSFTLHGLWPDNCDGSYDSYCDWKRKEQDIPGVILDASCPSTKEQDESGEVTTPVGDDTCADAKVLLENMHTYWVANDGNNPRLWAHEWNKHGTCISTLSPDCYTAAAVSSLTGPRGGDKSSEGLIRYFTLAMHLFFLLPTFDWLQEAGIMPSRNTLYDSKRLVDVLGKERAGVTPVLRCDHGGAVLREVWYYFLAEGDLRSGEGGFVPTEAPERVRSNCRDFVRYLPKNTEEPLEIAEESDVQTSLEL